MKKFFCIIPFTLRIKSVRYIAVDNQKLDLGHPTAFPTVAAVNGFVEPQEDFEIVMLVTTGSDNYLSEDNIRTLQDQISEVCRDKGLKAPSWSRIELTNDESVTVQLQTFRKVLEQVQEEDEVFACITYGTKPVGFTLLSAIQNAYKIRKNTSLGCIYYGQFDRGTGESRIYDMTALSRMNSVINSLIKAGVKDKDSALKFMMDF